MKHFNFGLLLSLNLMFGTAAFSQSNPVIGSWQCAMSYTEFNASGNRTSGFTEQYLISFNPDSTFYVTGQQMSIGGTWSYQGQGQWRSGQTAQGFAVGGQGVRSDPMVGQAPYAFSAYVGPNGQNLFNQFDTPFPNGQGVQARTLVQCDRA